MKLQGYSLVATITILTILVTIDQVGAIQDADILRKITKKLQDPNLSSQQRHFLELVKNAGDRRTRKSLQEVNESPNLQGGQELDPNGPAKVLSRKERVTEVVKAKPTEQPGSDDGKEKVAQDDDISGAKVKRWRLPGFSQNNEQSEETDDQQVPKESQRQQPGARNFKPTHYMKHVGDQRRPLTGLPYATDMTMPMRASGRSQLMEELSPAAPHGHHAHGHGRVFDWQGSVDTELQQGISPPYQQYSEPPQMPMERYENQERPLKSMAMYRVGYGQMGRGGYFSNPGYYTEDGMEAYNGPMAPQMGQQPWNSEMASWYTESPNTETPTPQQGWDGSATATLNSEMPYDPATMEDSSDTPRVIWKANWKQFNADKKEQSPFPWHGQHHGRQAPLMMDTAEVATNEETENSVEPRETETEETPTVQQEESSKKEDHEGASRQKRQTVTEEPATEVTTAPTPPLVEVPITKIAEIPPSSSTGNHWDTRSLHDLLPRLEKLLVQLKSGEVGPINSTDIKTLLANTTDHDKHEKVHETHEHHHELDHTLQEFLTHSLYGPQHPVGHQEETHEDTALQKEFRKLSEEVQRHLHQDQGMNESQALFHLANYRSNKNYCASGDENNICSVKFFTFCADPHSPSIGFRLLTSQKYLTEPRLSDVRHLGCFRDTNKHNVLVDMMIFEDTNSPHACIAECQQQRFKFAALEHGFECWCQTEPPEFDERTTGDDCDHVCPGDPTKTCGGNETIDIYDTGVHHGHIIPKHAFVGCLALRDLEPGTWPARTYHGKQIGKLECLALCWKDNDRVFALDYQKNQCFCGSHLPQGMIRIGERLYGKASPTDLPLSNKRADANDKCHADKLLLEIYGASGSDDELEKEISRSFRAIRHDSVHKATRRRSKARNLNLAKYPMLPLDLERLFKGGFPFMGLSRTKRVKRSSDIHDRDQFLPVLQWECASLDGEFNQTGSYQLTSFEIDGTTFLTERLKGFDYKFGAVCRLFDKRMSEDSEKQFAVWANCPAPPGPVADLTACETDVNFGMTMLNWTRPFDKGGRPVRGFDIDCHTLEGKKCPISASSIELDVHPENGTLTGVHVASVLPAENPLEFKSEEETAPVEAHRCLCSIRSHANGIWSPWSPTAPEVCVRREERLWTVYGDGYRYFHESELDLEKNNKTLETMRWVAIAGALFIALIVVALLAHFGFTYYRRKLDDESHTLFSAAAI